MAFRLGAALFEVVQYLHKRRVVHRDLNPTNVLISPTLDELRVTDFNTAVLLSPASQPLTPTGARLYSPPEVLAGEAPMESGDVWTAGLCMYLMASGQLPQGRRHTGQLLAQRRLVELATQRACFDGPRWQRISETRKSVMAACLSIETAERPTADAVLARLAMQAQSETASGSAPEL